MKRLLVLFFLTISYPAVAQEVPYTIDVQTHISIMKFLEDIPAKYANPIANVLLQKQKEAMSKQSDKEEKPKSPAK